MGNAGKVSARQQPQRGEGMAREKVTSPATAVFRALAALAVGLLGAAPLSPLTEPLEGMAGVDGASGARVSGGQRYNAGQHDWPCQIITNASIHNGKRGAGHRLDSVSKPASSSPMTVCPQGEP